MTHFIIGDIHGCYHTLCELLTHWDSEHEHLIFVGDLIDRGNHSAQVVAYVMALTQKHPNITVLKGNHEAEAITYFKTGNNPNWLPQGGKQTLVNFDDYGLCEADILSFFETLPLRYETDSFIVTHAGICKTALQNLYDDKHPDSVLWTRKPIKHYGKLQIHGHSPLKQKAPLYNSASYSWNIDTGAYYGFGLSGIKLDTRTLNVQSKVISVATHLLDID